MTKGAWIGIAIAVLIILFGAYWYKDEIKGYPPPWAASSTPQTQENGTAGIANPASTNCITLGGTLQIMDEVNGQVGYCHMKDGRVCEEWALFRDGSCVIPR